MKAAWITPTGHGTSTLTLEADGPEPHQGPVVRELTFPAEGPQRRTIAISGLTDEDLDNLRLLLDSSAGYAGYEQARVEKE